MNWVARQPYLLLSLAPLFWAGNLILARGLRAEIPPVGLAFWRWVAGSAIALAFAWPHLRADWATIRQHWRTLALLSVLGIGAFNTLLYVGLQSTPALNGLLVQASLPLFVALLSYCFFGDRLTIRQQIGLALALLGAIAIISRGNWQVLANLDFNPGDLWIFLAAICYAAYSSLLRLRPAIHPLSFLVVLFMGGALFLLPLYVWESGDRPLRWNPTTAAAITYVAIFPSLLSYLCYNRGVELVGANRAGLFIYLLPLFGSLLAVALLGERFQSYHLLGLAAIAGGIAIANWRRSPADP